MVPPGWYVTRGGGRGGAGAGLLAGLQVNSLDTWDLARLGWLKVSWKRTFAKSKSDVSPSQRIRRPLLGLC